MDIKLLKLFVDFLDALENCFTMSEVKYAVRNFKHRVRVEYKI